MSQAVQWIEEKHICSGVDMVVTAKHDTYGITFEVNEVHLLLTCLSILYIKASIVKSTLMSEPYSFGQYAMTRIGRSFTHSERNISITSWIVTLNGAPGLR